MSARTICENCDGEGYTDMGASACAVCLGAGVMTPEMLAANLAYHLMCEEDRRLQAGIHEIIGICEQDARDQEHNATLTGWGRCSKAYAEGRGTACKGIAAHLKRLLPVEAQS